MYLSRPITIVVTLAIMAGATFADSEETVCHSGNTVSISQDALEAHQDHGDTMRTCPPAPVYKDVAMIRCVTNDHGDMVVSELSASRNKRAGSQGAAVEESCANAVAHIIIMGTALIR